MFSEENFLAAHMGFNGNLRDQDGKKLGAGGGCDDSKQADVV